MLMRLRLQNKFDYIEHYKTDSEEFDYFEERFGATKDDEKRLREYIISVTPKASNFILDIGCGSGWVAKYFCEKNFNTISSDLAYKNVKKSKEITNVINHSGLVTDSFNPSIKSEKIDTIISSEVIEHVTKPDEFIKSLYKLLAKKGKLIISTPYNEKLRYVLCTHCNKKTPIHAHLHSFTEKFFINLQSELPNSNIKYYIFGNKLLIFLRTYIILKYLPFKVWKLIDWIFNKIFNKPVHLIVVYSKN